MAPRAVLLRTLRARQLEARALPLRFPSPARPSATSISPLRAFSASSRSCNAQKEEPKGDQQQKDGGGGGGGGSSGKKQEQRQAPRPDEASGPPQSPFKVFAQVLKEEISKNKAWQENVKTLQGDVDKLADTQAMKRARDMYERARVSQGLGLGGWPGAGRRKGGWWGNDRGKDGEGRVRMVWGGAMR